MSAVSEDRPRVKGLPPLVFIAVLIVTMILESLWGTAVPVPMAGLRRWLAVLVLGFAGYLALGAWWLMIRTGTHVDPRKPTRTIVARGPFRITRNPMYLCLVLVLLGIAILRWSPWFLLAAAFLGITLQRTAILPEEAYLEAKFGADYLAYKARVRRWL